MFERMGQKAPASAADAQREAALFAAALERPPAERAAFLDGACHGDPALRARLDALLAAHEHPAALLDVPADAPRPAPGIRFAEAADEAVGQTLGRYKLLEKIGEGGYGVVYVAEQTEPLRRRVALKVIKLGMDTKQVVARFEAERQALALMDHPNIAKVLDAGTTGDPESSAGFQPAVSPTSSRQAPGSVSNAQNYNAPASADAPQAGRPAIRQTGSLRYEGAIGVGRPYFVMELVRGIKITDYCDQAQLTTKERLDLFIKVCQAIQHAHQKGIIHRDIKPSNILVTLHDGVPVPKVIDFGIAKATEGRLTDATVYTQLHQFIGTPAYISPEQAELSGLDIDTRSDIYSLGVLLYELLTGCTPFDPKELVSQGLEGMRKTIREKEPLRPSTRLATLGADQLTTTSKRRSAEAPKLIHQIKGDLDWIVMKCLEKDRARRYETANGLAADLKRFLNHEPVVARPPSTAYRLQKAFRRNKVVFTAAAAVVMALVLGLGTSLWQTTVATHERAAALAERNKAIETRKLAEEARQRADEERARAEASEQLAQRSLYTANLNLAQQAWEQNNVGRVRQLLEETANYPDRGFEWYYWQRQTHLELKTLRGHIGGVTSVAFSPDGQWILTGSGDGTAKVWDASTGQERLTLKGHGAGIVSVAFSPDGRRILTGSDDGTAKVWDASTGQERLTLKGHSDSVTSVAFSPDGQRILTGSFDQTAKVWDASSDQERLTLKGHGDAIWSVAFSPDGQRILTGSWDHTAIVWEAATPEQVAAWEQEERAAMERLAVLRQERAAALERERAVRAQDPGAIQRWLVLAPIRFDGDNGAAALDQEQVPHEAGLRPAAGQRIRMGDTERTWIAVEQQDYVFDFNQVVGAETSWSVAYAVCYVRLTADQTGLVMKVGSDDQAKVYLDGKEAYRQTVARSYRPDQDAIAGLDLKAGLHVVVFKVVNETGGWQGSIRFTDRDGQPVPGIRVTLDPGDEPLAAP